MRIFLDRLAPVLEGMERVHLVCADPGAYAVQGLVEPMLRAQGVAGAFFVEGWAMGKGDPRGAAFSREALRSVLCGSDAVLLGARVDFARTRQILDFCRSLGVRTALVFDHWKNFTEHFAGAGGVVLPDFILLPDAMARSELLKRFAAHPALAGRFAESRALVFGHPALDASARAIAEADPQEAQALRRALGCGSGPLAALFLDPVRPEDGLGYDVASVLEYIAAWVPANRPGATVLVKAHPRQDPPLTEADLAPFAKAGVDARLVGGAFEPLAAAADEVWGMTSLALVAARKGGRPVVSFQPGRTAAGREQSNLHLEECVVI